MALNDKLKLAEALLWEKGLCTYCGSLAQEKEHAITKKTLRRVAGSLNLEIEKVKDARFQIVPTCKECNQLLAQEEQTNSLETRVLIVKQKLKLKYAKLLAMSDWTEEELSEMGSTMREDINRALNHKHFIKARLNYFIVKRQSKNLCPMCQNAFKASRKWQKYCSPQCRIAYFEVMNPRSKVM